LVFQLEIATNILDPDLQQSEIIHLSGYSIVIPLNDWEIQLIQTYQINQL